MSFDVTAQNVNLVLDTISYKDVKFYEGQEIMLGKSFAGDSIFSNVMTGPKIDSLEVLPAAFANQPLKVALLYKNDFGYVIVASPPEGASLRKLIFIRVEQALSSRELLAPECCREKPVATVAELKE
jgi:hypothetical protein